MSSESSNCEEVEGDGGGISVMMLNESGLGTGGSETLMEILLEVTRGSEQGKEVVGRWRDDDSLTPVSCNMER